MRSISARLPSLEEAFKKNQKTPLYAQLADCFLQDGSLEKVERAKSILEIGIKHHPKDANGHYLLGRVYFKQGDVKHARSELERVLKFYPMHIGAYSLLIEMNESEGLSQVNENLKQMLKQIDPFHPVFTGKTTSQVKPIDFSSIDSDVEDITSSSEGFEEDLEFELSQKINEHSDDEFSFGSMGDDLSADLFADELDEDGLISEDELEMLRGEIGNLLDEKDTSAKEDVLDTLFEEEPTFEDDGTIPSFEEAMEKDAPVLESNPLEEKIEALDLEGVDFFTLSEEQLFQDDPEYLQKLKDEEALSAPEAGDVEEVDTENVAINQTEESVETVDDELLSMLETDDDVSIDDLDDFSDLSEEPKTDDDLSSMMETSESTSIDDLGEFETSSESTPEVAVPEELMEDTSLDETIADELDLITEEADLNLDSALEDSAEQETTEVAEEELSIPEELMEDTSLDDTIADELDLITEEADLNLDSALEDSAEQETTEVAEEELSLPEELMEDTSLDETIADELDLITEETDLNLDSALEDSSEQETTEVAEELSLPEELMEDTSLDDRIADELGLITEEADLNLDSALEDSAEQATTEVAEEELSLPEELMEDTSLDDTIADELDLITEGSEELPSDDVFSFDEMNTDVKNDEIFSEGIAEEVEEINVSEKPVEDIPTPVAEEPAPEKEPPVREKLSEDVLEKSSTYEEPDLVTARVLRPEDVRDDEITKLEDFVQNVNEDQTKVQETVEEQPVSIFKDDLLTDELQFIDKDETKPEEKESSALISPTLGEIHMAQGRFKEAKDIFEKLLEKNPDDEKLKRKIRDINDILSS